MESATKNIYLRILQIILIGVIVLIVYPFILPIVMASIFAALLWPWMMRPWPHIKSRNLKAFLLTMGFTFLIVGPVLSLIGGGVFALQKKIQEGAFDKVDFAPSHWIRSFLDHDLVMKMQETVGVSDAQVRTAFSSVLQNIQVVAVNFLQSILTSAPQAILAFIIMVLCLFWILKDQDRIADWIFHYSPWSHEQTLSLLETFRNASIAVVMAGILSGTAQAIVIGGGAAISGLGNPGVAAMIVFFASFFPFLGSGLVSISLIIFGLATGSTKEVLIFLPFAGLSSVVDNIIYPFVVGGRIEMNALVSFLAVLGGIELFGLFGIFIGPIVLILCLKILSLLDGREIKRHPPRPPSQLLLTLRANWPFRGRLRR